MPSPVGVMTDIKWSCEQTKQFLQIYRKYECLWNVYMADYGNRAVRKAAFSEMMYELAAAGMPVTDTWLRVKIKSLRDTYRNELNRINKSMHRGEGATYEPKLGWFRTADEFLRDVFLLGKETSFNWELSRYQENCQVLISEADQNGLHYIKTEPADDMLAQTPPPFDNSPPPPPLKKVRVPFPEREEPPVFKTQPDSTSEENDQYSIFGRYVASEMRNTSTDYLRRKMKRKIQEVILEINNEEEERADENSHRFPGK